MKIKIGSIIKIEYTITTETGEMIESSAGRGAPLEFVFGTNCGLPSGLNAELEGMGEDEEKEFDLPPERAFGTIDMLPTMPLPKNAFPDGESLHIGRQFQAEMPGTNQTVNFTIKEIRPEGVIVRLDHPLAGKTIHMKVKVLEIREPN